MLVLSKLSKRLELIVPVFILFQMTDSMGQTSPPPSALINQQSQQTLEAARAASPHTSESTYAYFEDEAQAFIEDAIQYTWDPAAPRPIAAKTDWGDPVLGGYWRKCCLCAT